MSREVEMSVDQRILEGQLVPLKHWVTEYLRNCPKGDLESAWRIEISVSGAESAYVLTRVEYRSITTDPVSTPYEIVLNRIPVGRIPEGLAIVSVPYEVLKELDLPTRCDTFIGLEDVCDKTIETMVNFRASGDAIKALLPIS
jgi:hypothetical protein